MDPSIKKLLRALNFPLCLPYQMMLSALGPGSALKPVLPLILTTEYFFWRCGVYISDYKYKYFKVFHSSVSVCVCVCVCVFFKSEVVLKEHVAFQFVVKYSR